MTSWMSSLIGQQDGCLRIVPHQASQGRLRQEQLAQTVARTAPSTTSSNRDQVQYLRAQLAHRDAQLEHVRSERDAHLFKKKNCLLTCVCSAVKLKSGNPEWSAKRNKFYVKSPQKQLIEPQKCKKPWTNNSYFKPVGDKQKQNSGVCVSPTALRCRLLQPVCETVNWNTSSYILPMRDACSWRHNPPNRRSQDLEQESIQHSA